MEISGPQTTKTCAQPPKLTWILSVTQERVAWMRMKNTKQERKIEVDLEDSYTVKYYSDPTIKDHLLSQKLRKC